MDERIVSFTYVLVLRHTDFGWHCEQNGRPLFIAGGQVAPRNADACHRHTRHRPGAGLRRPVCVPRWIAVRPVRGLPVAARCRLREQPIADIDPAKIDAAVKNECDRIVGALLGWRIASSPPLSRGIPNRPDRTRGARGEIL